MDPRASILAAIEAAFDRAIPGVAAEGVRLKWAGAERDPISGL
jgi:hypothetical protein